MRDGKNDWQTLSPRRRKHTLAGLVDVYADKSKPLTKAQQRLLDEANQAGALPKRTGKAVQHESAEMQRLVALVERAWWEPGWWRFEHATMHPLEAERNAREGVRPGWPDCGLLVPMRGLSNVGNRWNGPAVRAMCELKRPDLRPKSAGPSWWLGLDTEWRIVTRKHRDGSTSQERARVLADTGAESRAGVSADQIFCLNLLDRCGFDTFVAYGAEQAFAWFDNLAGPEVEVVW